MAHFAELNENNKVLRVIVLNNEDITDNNGVEQESVGVFLCGKYFGGTWIQTSYNGSIRGKYAGVGDTYDAKYNVFITPGTTYDPITETYKPMEVTE